MQSGIASGKMEKHSAQYVISLCFCGDTLAVDEIQALLPEVDPDLVWRKGDLGIGNYIQSNSGIKYLVADGDDFAPTMRLALNRAGKAIARLSTNEDLDVSAKEMQVGIFVDMEKASCRSVVVASELLDAAAKQGLDIVFTFYPCFEDE